MCAERRLRGAPPHARQWAAGRAGGAQKPSPEHADGCRAQDGLSMEQAVPRGRVLGLAMSMQQVTPGSPA